MQKQSPRSSVKKVFLKSLQTSQEKTCVRVFFLIKLQAISTFFKKRLQRKCFPKKFAKLLRTPILNICKRLLVEVFYKKLFLKLCNIHRTKVASDKFSQEMVFLVVDTAVKVTFFILINISCKKV